MTKLKIPHGAFVFVGDGRKALFFAMTATKNSLISRRKEYSRTTIR